MEESEGSQVIGGLEDDPGITSWCVSWHDMCELDRIASLVEDSPTSPFGYLTLTFEIVLDIEYNI